MGFGNVKSACFALAGSLFGAAMGLSSAMADIGSNYGGMATQQNLGQEPGIETVTTRRGPLDPEGLQMGSFSVLPALTVGIEYDDNIFYEVGGEDDDLSFLIIPEVGLESNWSRHELQLFAGGTFEFHDTFSNEDKERFSFEARGRIDVTRDTAIGLNAGYNFYEEDRGDPDVVLGAVPTDVERLQAGLSLAHRFNRVDISIAGNFLSSNYDDVPDPIVLGIINNDDRDRDEFGLTARIGVKVTPSLTIFATAAYEWADYDIAVDDKGFIRDSERFVINGGIEWVISQLVSLQAFVGYREEMFDDPTFANDDNINFGALILWNPTQLATVTVSARRSFEETTLVGSPGFYADRVEVGLTYEVLRSLILAANFAYGRNDYVRADQGLNDDVWNFGASATYKINRYFHVALSYLFEDRDSGGLVFNQTQNYSRNKVLLRLKAQY